MSDNEVEKMVKDAEMNASTDKEKREKIDIKNQAETLVYQAENKSVSLETKLMKQQKRKLKRNASS